MMKWLIISLVFAFSAQEMSEAEIKSFKAGVKKTAELTETLSADFSQFRHSSYLAKPAQSSGKMYFTKEGFVAWNYISPEAIAILFRDKKMYVRQKGKTKDLQGGKRLEKFNGLIAGSLTGDLFDAPQFQYQFLKKTTGNWVILTVKDAQLKRMVKKIEMHFQDHVVDEVIMTDPSGDYTHIKFKNREVNKKLPAQIFQP
jgi:outer membrane lipoprotein carrier protein